VSPVPAGLYALEHEPYDEHAAVVVLIHGTMDRSAAFGRVVQRLSDLHVIVYDRRGYGRSAQAEPPASTLADHADDLVAVLDGRRAVLVGHSYGGDVALLVACEHPELVTAAGVFETPMPWMPWWSPDNAGSPALAAAASGSPGDAAEAFLRRTLGDRGWQELPPQTRAARREEGAVLVSDLASLRNGAPFDLSTLTVPLVVGSGSTSPSYHRDGARELAVATGADLVEIEGGSHGSHTSHPDEFSAFVRKAVALAPGRN
jgi:pimeloyl-ACP methyl ester carboxylesterase